VAGSNLASPLLPHSILYPELKRLLDAGAQLVEVLPEDEYREEHCRERSTSS
jgi:hypothetical protein